MAPFKPRLVRSVRSKLNSRLRCYGLTAKEIIEINEIESQIIALTAMKLSLEASPLENVFLPEMPGSSADMATLLLCFEAGLAVALAVLAPNDLEY